MMTTHGGAARRRAAGAAARAPAPSCAGRSASPSSAACSSRRSSRSTRRRSSTFLRPARASALAAAPRSPAPAPPEPARGGLRMNISEPFIRRPVATSLLSVALAAGRRCSRIACCRWRRCRRSSSRPSRSRPQLPGASPETMASSVATPLERQFGRIAGVTEMTSTSTLGATTITLQFDLDRSIDAAARDVQAAINAARSQLPPNLPNNPELPQGQPGRRADPDPGADLRRAAGRAHVTTPPTRSWRRSSRRWRASAR